MRAMIVGVLTVFVVLTFLGGACAVMAGIASGSAAVFAMGVYSMLSALFLALMLNACADLEAVRTHGAEQLAATKALHQSIESAREEWRNANLHQSSLPAAPARGVDHQAAGQRGRIPGPPPPRIRDAFDAAVEEDLRR